MTVTFLVILTILALVNLAIIFYILIKNSSEKTKIDEAQNQAIRDLERRLTDVMVNQMNTIRTSFDGTSRSMHEQIRSFTQEATQIREELKQVGASIKDVSSFQEIFKSPKLRGQWGESSLENILSQHYPKEMYETQHYFSSGEAVDFVLKLPDGRLLPIDSKFPADNFSKMINATTETERQFHRDNFINDVKKEIDAVSSKYILPQENTMDMAIMYIPAEAIYYEMMHHIPMDTNVDLVSYAIKKKVVLTSPNILYLTLNTIEHWLRDTQISKQTQMIIKRLGQVKLDAEKLSETFRKLGKHLNDTQSAYDDSDKRLSLMTNRVVNLIDVGQKAESEEQLEAPTDQVSSEA